MVHEQTGKQIIIEEKAIRGANKDTIDFFNDSIEKILIKKLNLRKEQVIQNIRIVIVRSLKYM